MTPTHVGGYQLLRLLGRGASGSVYEALPIHEETSVALKLLDGEAHSQDWQQSLRKLMTVDHPSLARITKIFPDQRPPYYVMRLVDGPDLLGYVREYASPNVRRHVGGSSGMLLLGTRANEDGCSDFSSCGEEGYLRARRTMLQLSQALECMHLLGLVHCDVRPDNIRVEDGRAVLLDYGLSRDVHTDPDIAAPMGTVAYMAPEQWRSENITPAVDLYALGVTLFEALVGALPFTGSADDVFMRKRSVGAPAPSFFVPGVPEDLDRLCADLMRASPELRPSLAEIHARLS